MCIDSLRQDHVGAYRRLGGGTGVGAAADAPVFAGLRPPATPGLDAFAAHSLCFTNAYPCNIPTIPIRHELMTGHFGLHQRAWQPLVPTDLTAAEILAAEGYTCALVSDTYHYRAPGMNFHRGFHAYEWIRGNEYDPWVSAPTRRSVDDYVTPGYDARWRGRVAQYLANTDGFGRDRPGDWFAAQVADRAVHWLRANRDRRPVFLWIDSFDPHEPWDPPAPFDLYRPAGYAGPRLVMPMGGRALDWATPEQVDQIRGLYAGEVASVDAALGQVLAALAEQGYLEDSVVLVLADHGHPLADHGKFLKGPDRMYSELLKVPFMLHLPGGRRGVTDTLVQYPDVLPTLLDLLGLGAYGQTMTGRSFRDVAAGGAETHRDVTVSGFHAAVDRAVRDGRWSYVRRPGDEPDELYDLRADPRERTNRIDEAPAVAQGLLARVAPQFLRQRVRAVKGLMGRYELGSGSVG